jgi:hypothetical protein
LHGQSLQVRQQLLELQQLREELSAQRRALSDVQQVYQGSKSATEQRMGQSQAEVATLAQEVQKLQEILQVGARVQGSRW